VSTELPTYGADPQNTLPPTADGPALHAAPFAPYRHDMRTWLSSRAVSSRLLHVRAGAELRQDVLCLHIAFANPSLGPQMCESPVASIMGSRAGQQMCQFPRACPTSSRELASDRSYYCHRERTLCGS
jgi:hypothetical protein